MVTIFIETMSTFFTDTLLLDGLLTSIYFHYS